MGRSPCCSKEGMNRGAWTVLEDKILTEYIKVHGEGRWRNLPKKAGLKRCGKSCRLRWLNYLRPDIKRGNITPDEEELIIRLHKLLGNRWSLIAGRLPGRTDNEIKNYWNTKIGKKRQENQSSAAGTPNNKSDDKNKKKSTGDGDGDGDNEPPSTNSAAAPPPPPKMQPHVVHTKAMRCTKAFINPHPHKVLEHVKTNHPQVGPPSSIVRDRSIDQQADNYHYGSNNNGISSFTTGDVDFMMDFSMGELNLSDLLNSNFSADLCNFNYSDDNSTELSPSSTDQPLMFTGEMLEDWALKDGTTHQPNVNYFSSFIDSDGDWLRE